MNDAYQHNPGSSHVNRLHPAPGVSVAPELKPFLVASLGILLGIVTGSVIGAHITRVASPDASLQEPSINQPTPASVPAATASAAQPTPPTHLPLPSVQSKPAAGQFAPTLVTHRHRFHRHGLRRAAYYRHRHSYRTLRVIPDVPLAVAAIPSSAPSEEQPRTSLGFFIEGGLTAVEFNPAAGTIETYEGETFAIDKTVGEISSLPLQDYPVNLHYRCDQSGNCTLNWPGVNTLAARRTHKTDLSL